MSAPPKYYLFQKILNKNIDNYFIPIEANYSTIDYLITYYLNCTFRPEFQQSVNFLTLNFAAVKQQHQQQNGSGSGTASAASAAHKVARQIMDEEAATTSPGMARSPAMHQGFRQEEWVVERTPVNTPDDKVVLVGKKCVWCKTRTKSDTVMFVLKVKKSLCFFGP